MKAVGLAHASGADADVTRLVSACDTASSRGCPAVLAVGARLDEHAGRRLVAKIEEVGRSSGGVIVDLATLRSWTPDGLFVLNERMHHQCRTRAPVAACASPTGFTLATTARMPTFPSADLAVQGLNGTAMSRRPHGADRDSSVVLRHARQTFSNHPSEAFAARHWVRVTLNGWRLDARIDEAVLAVTELVTNSIRHTGSDSLSVTLRARRDRRGLRMLTVSVGDDHSGLGAARSDASSAPAVDGRGLSIVNALTDRFGWHPAIGRPGKEVVLPRFWAVRGHTMICLAASNPCPHLLRARGT